MAIHHNPSIEFYRTQNVRTIIRSLEKLKRKVSEFQDSDSNTESLWLTSEGEVEEFNPQIGTIYKIHRGSLIQETKETLRSRIPRVYKGYYQFWYYGIESTKGNFLLIFGRRDASRLLYRILKSMNHNLARIGLGRSVQDRLCTRSDMFYFSSSIDDEMEELTGKLKVSSRSTDTPLKGAKIEKLIDRRGRKRDQGITWRETSVRPKIVFWINNAGRLYVKKIDVDEAFMLELVDIVIGVI